MPRFGSSPHEDADFLADYLRTVAAFGSENVGAWLLENAPRMREGMFRQAGVALKRLEPLDLWVLRAVAPDGVFTREAQADFLRTVRGIEKLERVADTTFHVQDTAFLGFVPDEMAPHIRQLADIACTRGIRPRPGNASAE